VWDAQKGTEVLALKGHTGYVTSVSFSPDGKRILTGSWDKTAKVWDAQKGTEVLALKGHTDFVTSVSFSPDGKRILTGSQDTTAKVWDADKGTEVLALKGHTLPVTSVSFSPDGKKAFAWDTNGKVLAWDTTTGQPVAADNPPPRPAPGPAISPDGRLSAKPVGFGVAVVDLLRPALGDSWPFPDAVERKRYHSEQAALAATEEQWFAAAFHLGRLLLDDPGNAELTRRRDEALKLWNRRYLSKWRQAQ